MPALTNIHCMKKIIHQTAFPKSKGLKAIMLMKLTLAFLLISTLQLSANVYSQETVTLKLQSVELKKALVLIEKQTSYRFLYKDDMIADSRKVDVDAENEPVIQVLDDMLKGSGLLYRVLNNNLVVITRADQLQKDITVTGRISNQAGEPVPSVTVKVKGSSAGVSANANGEYSINVPEDAVLVFSSIGYETQEVAVGGRSVINVVLQPSTKALDQVVVVGFGTQRKIDVTGSISSVKGAEIAKQSSQNAISSLQGKVAGVQITNSGSPGSSPSVRIRGVGSIFNPNPMYIVDGTIVNDISFLNPNDIESIDVLKDASSLSIYGVRAGNGVILVTTKKGRKGKPVFSLNSFTGAQIITNPVQMATAKKYAFMINEKLGTPTVGEYPTTDWYDEILRGLALTHNHQLSVSGGTGKVNYNSSIGYYNQQGLVENNVYNKITGRLQADYRATKELKFGASALFYHYNSTDIPGDIFYQAYVAPPIMAVRKPNGFYGDPADYNVGNFANPRASLDWFNRKSKGNSITASVYGEYKFLKHFSFRSSFGITRGQYLSRRYVRKDSLTTVQFSNISSLNRDTSNETKWIWDNTLTYERVMGKHRVKALAGYSSSKDKFINDAWFANDVPFNGEGSLEIANGDPASVRYTLSGSEATFVSYFARFNYAYDDKYLFTATLRRDGSSKFPSDNRFDNFPSFGVGWIVTKEKFMENQEIFDMLKLKASWGRLGNANIPANIFVARVDSGGIYNYVFSGTGGQVSSGANNTVFPPKNFFWEKMEETDIGIEMSLLKSRLFLEVDYYDRTTRDGIFSLPILGTTGASNNSVAGNFATYNNKGFDINATWNASTRKFKYNIGANLSINTNRVISIEGGNVDLYGGGLPVAGYLTTVARVGQPIGSFYGFEVEGIFQTAQEVSASAQPFAKPGYFKYKDQNGDKLIDARDKVILGNPNPKYTYGINMGMEYRNWDFQLDIQGVAGVDLYNATKGVRYGNENYTEDFYQNRWFGPGTSNTYPSAALEGPNLDPNSWFVEKGDYIRIRNVQIGYTLKESVLKRWKLQKLRFFANAQNPFTYFKYKGFTPEIGGAPMSTGIDLNVYPLSATYNVGFNINF